MPDYDCLLMFINSYLYIVTGLSLYSLLQGGIHIVLSNVFFQRVQEKYLQRVELFLNTVLIYKLQFLCISFRCTAYVQQTVNGGFLVVVLNSSMFMETFILCLYSGSAEEMNKQHKK